MRPYSQNIIFVDTEFSSLDPYEGEILSIGLLTSSGESLYLELEHKGEVSDWVKENLVPKLSKKKVSRKEARSQIRSFIENFYNQPPHIVGYAGHFDFLYIVKLFADKEIVAFNFEPFHWLPIDLSSILFAQGEDPLALVDRKGACDRFSLNQEDYDEHNALSDAKFVRDVYFTLIPTSS